MATNVYVGRLPRSFTEDDLRILFAHFGPILSSHLVLDKQTGRSRGYGFVNFDSVISALAAVVRMNDFDVAGHRLIVKLADNVPASTISEQQQQQPGPLQSQVPQPLQEHLTGVSFGGNLNPSGSSEFPRSHADQQQLLGLHTGIVPNSSLFVHNIPIYCELNDLICQFRPFGVLQDCTLFTANVGVTKRCAIVRFRNEREASSAIDALNLWVPGGQNVPLQVRFADWPDEKLAQDCISSSKPTNLDEAQWRVIHERFDNTSISSSNTPVPTFNLAAPLPSLPHSTIASTSSRTWPQQPLSSVPAPGPTIAHPSMKPSSLLESSLGAFPTTAQPGPMTSSTFPIHHVPGGNPSIATTQQLYPSPQPPQVQLVPPICPSVPPPEENTNLYVYGFGRSSNVDELFLYKTFAPFGAIASVKLMVDVHTGQSKGYGFVRFQKEADAHMAMNMLQDVPLGTKTLHITIHRPKES